LLANDLIGVGDAFPSSDGTTQPLTAAGRDTQASVKEEGKDEEESSESSDKESAALGDNLELIVNAAEGKNDIVFEEY
jgi:hypothetical protein